MIYLKSILKESVKQEKNGLLAGISINRDYDIPYLCGYSQDGSTIYIDKDFPQELGFDEFLSLHEISEKMLEDTMPDYYQHAHKIATKLEHYFLELEGIDPVKYENIVQKYVKMAYAKEPKSCPKDLDLQPYEDENDQEAIEKIKRAQ